MTCSSPSYTYGKHDVIVNCQTDKCLVITYNTVDRRSIERCKFRQDHTVYDHHNHSLVKTSYLTLRPSSCLQCPLCFNSDIAHCTSLVTVYQCFQTTFSMSVEAMPHTGAEWDETQIQSVLTGLQNMHVQVCHSSSSIHRHSLSILMIISF